jgi:hypothetical protein
MTWYTDTYSIMAMSLLYKINDMVKCVCYMNLESNDCFVTGATLKGCYYKMYIISGVGHLMPDLIVLLLLWMIAFSIQGTVLYYRSLETAATLLRRNNISGKPYMKVMAYKALAFLH